MVCYIGVGSNVGDRLEFIRKAIAILKEKPGIRVGKISPIYETPAEGGPRNQPDYLNLALEVETELAPEALLEILKNTETRVGRRVRPERWAEREIDLDLLLCGTLEMKKGSLVVPHPLMKKRYFVLKPLSDLAPGLVPPGATKDVSSLLADLKGGPKGRNFEEAV
jgi:2-amino-4-hydroxy-6-hydroxymethyldihydropteridine diphosphokinase